MSRLGDRVDGRYGLALLLILTSMIFIMAVPDTDWSRVTALALQGGALLASLRAAQSDARLRTVCGILIGIALVVAVALAIAGADVGEKFVRWATMLLVVTATPVIGFGIVRQVKEKRQITIHTMMGVLCIYLLMGLAFAAGFALIAVAGDQPFFRPGDGADTVSNYLYFSLTTITTAGLGDFSPRDDLGRSLTAAEALIGQIYLVTVVAVIVANLGRRR